MFNVCLLALALFSDILVGPYRVADAEPEHHQVSLRAAMAADGRFAVAWLDSLQLSDHFVLDIYIRFFDKDGNPLSEAYKIPKPYDTTWGNFHTLDMDSLGNTVLVWTQGRTDSDTKLSNLRFMSFKPDGAPRDSAKTLYSNISLEQQNCVSLANNGECAIVFLTRLAGGSGYWVQRFDLSGVPQDFIFLAHTPSETFLPYDTLRFRYPRISLNDAGDLVVSWLDPKYTAHMYPRFQAFDADDKPILPWEPKGHRMDDGGERAGACRPDPQWIDNDRFVVFWTDYCFPPYLPVPLVGRVFSQRGAVKHPIRALVLDSLWGNVGDPNGRFYTAVLSDGRFAHTHAVDHSRPAAVSSLKSLHWEHAGGILGEVRDEEPCRKTNLFEYSAPWGEDTFWRIRLVTPAVAACDDRLVWVYSRFNPDTVLEAWAVISDWDMGVGISETPPVTPVPVTPPVTHQFEIANPIGSRIVLSYSDHPQGFCASVFDASGCKVDELSSPNQEGTLIWGRNQPSGVYFIVSESSPSRIGQKVVLVK